MCPVNGEDRKWANLDMLELLESRFTRERAISACQALLFIM